MPDSDAPRISALRPTQRDPNRATIKVDGRAVGTLSQKLLADLGLQVGQLWTEALATQVAEAVLFDKAFRAATRRLARRAMSRGMVERKLRELGHPPEAAAQVIERLESLDLLDDEAYGRALIRELTRAKPAGPMLLRQKLQQKGLERTLIDRLVAETTVDADDQRQAAADYARRKLRSLLRYEPAVQKRRLYGQLARRGFAPDTIRDAMDQVFRDA